MADTTRSLEADRLEAAVARAHANVAYPLSVDPQPQEADRIAAEKFLAMWTAAQRFPLLPAERRSRLAAPEEVDPTDLRW